MNAIYTALEATITDERNHVIVIRSIYVDSREILEKIPTRKKRMTTNFVSSVEELKIVISTKTAALFYDNCTLSGKGPSLGSEQTLLCPITTLSFHSRSDKELKKIGQDRYTMRISVGTEDCKMIIENLKSGLDSLAGHFKK